MEAGDLCGAEEAESDCEGVALSSLTAACNEGGGDDADDDGGATAGAYSPPTITMTLVAFAVNVLLMSI